MWNDDRETAAALRELDETAHDRSRQFIFWLGAGVSAWAGLPLWEELAEQLRRRFHKHVPAYDSKQANEALENGDLPALFEYLRNLSRETYHREIVERLNAPEFTPLFVRFVNCLRTITPLCIVSTNIDTTFEGFSPGLSIIGRCQIDQAVACQASSKDYLFKLHGSISDIESCIFTTSDYAGIETDSSFIENLRALISGRHLVFVGYSLRDEYFLRMLKLLDEDSRILGAGPHFLLSSTERSDLPKCIRILRYDTALHADHRSAIRALEFVSERRRGDGAVIHIDPVQKGCRWSAPKSRFYLPDVVPPGRWTTSQILHLHRESGDGAVELVVGPGLSSRESPYTESTALTDLAVALLCFEEVFLPLRCLGALLAIVGEAFLLQLLRDGVCQFVFDRMEIAVGFMEQNGISSGDLCCIEGRARNKSKHTIGTYITEQVHPRFSSEQLLNEAAELIGSRNLVYPESEQTLSARLTRGILNEPSMRESLGLSEFFRVDQIPRWSVFPAIRLAHAVRVAEICHRFEIAAAKIPFGAHQLAEQAFGSMHGDGWAYDVAAYVLVGRTTSAVGEFIQGSPDTLWQILRFRESDQGVRLRMEICDRLSGTPGAELESAINAGLRSSLPVQVLEDARDQMERLMTSSRLGASPVPAIVVTDQGSRDYLKIWRERSLRQLQDICKQRRIEPYNQCPCGSGEKLKFCCLAALRRKE